jgi:hypothetical protein
MHPAHISILRAHPFSPSTGDAEEPVFGGHLTCSAPWPSARAQARRIVVPSRAMSASARAASARIQAVNACGSDVGSSQANTRPHVSCDGRPWGRAKNAASHGWGAGPHGASSTQWWAPQMVARRAMVRLVSSAWRVVGCWRRGSGITAKEAHIGSMAWGVAIRHIP